MGDCDELVLLSGNACDAAIDGEVAGFDQCFTVGQESVFFVAVVDGGQALGDFELGMRKKHRDEALNDHVVELGFLLVKFDDTAGWDNRKVIRDLSVVEHALGELHAIILDRIDGPFSSRVS